MRRSLTLAIALTCSLVATSIPASTKARTSAIPTRHTGRNYVALVVVSAFYVGPGIHCSGRPARTADYPDDITRVSVSGGGATTTNTYDTSGTGELATQKVVTGSTTNFNWTFGYNAEGDETSASDSVSNSLNTYTYDQANRLTSWTQNSNPTNAFAYDGNGQLLTQTIGTGGSATAYHLNWDSAPSPALDEITQVHSGTTTYEYLVNGPGVNGGSEPYEQVGYTGTVSYLKLGAPASIRVDKPPQ